MGITIATSIAPKNIDFQKKAISTWKDLGFDVISINSAREIQQLAGYFPAVDFVEATRDASAIAGKPFVFFDDVLIALKSSGSEICGIVNSDIFLLDRKLLDAVAGEAREGFLFGSRIDIPSLDQRDGRFHLWGFDYFFFNRSIIDIYNQTDFCLGAPSWDYWAVLAPVVKGVAVKQLITPAAYHVRHSARYDYDLINRFGQKLLSCLRQGDLVDCMDKDLAAIVKEKGNETKFDLISLRICNYLIHKTQKISFSRTSDPGECNPVFNEETQYYDNLAREFRFGLVYQRIRTMNGLTRRTFDLLNELHIKMTGM